MSDKKSGRDLKSLAEENVTTNNQQSSIDIPILSEVGVTELKLLLDQITSNVASSAGPHHQIQSYTDILNVLSNVELPSSSPSPDDIDKQAMAKREDSKETDDTLSEQITHKGESGGTKKPRSTRMTRSNDTTQKRDSKRSKTEHQPRRSRSSEIHNMSERIRRDRINRKMKALQELIPNCSTRDKASILDDAIKYIKALQNQVQIMSMRGGGAFLQSPYGMLQASYQASQLAQLVQMRQGIGMGMYGFSMPSSGSVPVMTFGLPTPAPSAMPMVGPMPQLQVPLNPCTTLPLVDTTTVTVPISFTTVPSIYGCSVRGETSSPSLPGTSSEASKLLPMSQGSVSSGSTARVLASKVITPSPSSGNFPLEVQQVPNEDSDSSDSGL